MKCEKVMTAYLKSEDMDRIPFRVRLHTFFCPVCSAEIHMLMAVFKSLEARPVWRTERNITGSVMDSLRIERKYAERKVSGFNWVLIGLVIFSSILLVNFSNSFLWLNEQFGLEFIIPFSIVLGSILTVYIVLLTISNYEIMVKYLNIIHKGRSKS